MTVRFLHTADWQLGKPFAGIADIAKRARVQQERIEVIARIGQVALDHRAAFVVVAGDLFDSASVTRSIVSTACHAIGRLGLPVIGIPGNHDHAGPGSLWDQDFFRGECARLAPNFRLLSGSVAVDVGDAVIFPCPLCRRAESEDPTTWLRSSDALEGIADDKPRIVLAHGSVQGFGGAGGDDEDGAAGTPNLLDLSRLPADVFDYIALGDWHGTKPISALAWYSGTPEPDRFPKSADSEPGQVLMVTARRGAMPEVTPHRTARLTWRELTRELTDDDSLARLQQELATESGGVTPETLLRLELRGSLGLEATTRMEGWIESLEALLLRLKWTDHTLLAPTPAECDALALRTADPLISRVAGELLRRAAGGDESARIARVALRELHAECGRP